MHINGKVAYAAGIEFSIEDVFNNLSLNIEDVLKFINDKVAPDYEMFVNIGNQYEDDAKYVFDLSEYLSKGIEQIVEGVQQTTVAIEDVVASIQESSESSQDILRVITETSIATDMIAETSNEQVKTAETLNSVILKFKV
ncbi:hypothetical protein [Clostridium sp.]|uniref:hypothetical protein n=1 Tax=Clostridium sp. TaxID=1506 RepID=UPI003EEAC7C9